MISIRQFFADIKLTVHHGVDLALIVALEHSNLIGVGLGFLVLAFVFVHPKALYHTLGCVHLHFSQTLILLICHVLNDVKVFGLLAIGKD